MQINIKPLLADLDNPDNIASIKQFKRGNQKVFILATYSADAILKARNSLMTETAELEEIDHAD